MNISILVLLIGAVLLIMAMLERRNADKSQEAPPYFKKKMLLGEMEQVLFHRLVEALPTCYVMAQVRLADIVGVKSDQNWQKWFNKVSRKSVDFVICNKLFVVMACIELDGKTHEAEDRKKADRDKDEALQTAGVPLLRIAASKIPSVEEIKVLLKNAVLS